MAETISGNRLKQLTGLKYGKNRNRLQRYIISGERAVRGALSMHPAGVETILGTAETATLMTEIRKRYPVPGYAESLILTPAAFRKLTDEQHPQGIALVMKKPDTALKRDMDPGNRLICLDRINDPGNLGTIIRSAAWFGIAGILLSPGSADPFQGKSVRASAGAITGMPVYENVAAPDLVRLKKQCNYEIIAGVVGQGTALPELETTGATILLFGSEAHGLDPSFAGISDRHAIIPRYGFGESLNLAIAVGCFLYHLNIHTEVT